MKECPNCGSTDVLVHEIDSYFVNTGEFFCHSVKAHDADASCSCTNCDWEGKQRDLKETK